MSYRTTASWSSSMKISILRLFLALRTKDGVGSLENPRIISPVILFIFPSLGNVLWNSIFAALFMLVFTASIASSHFLFMASNASLYYEHHWTNIWTMAESHEWTHRSSSAGRQNFYRRRMGPAWHVKLQSKHQKFRMDTGYSKTWITRTSPNNREFFTEIYRCLRVCTICKFPRLRGIFLF